jgi:thermitase
MAMKNLKITSALLIAASILISACQSSNDLCTTDSHESQLSKGKPSANDYTQERNQESKQLQGEDRITSDIRWYAIENADNEEYWAAVNCNKLWVELRIGVGLNDATLSSFLTTFDLKAIDRSSVNPELTNYHIFSLENGTPERVLEIAQAAKSIDAILFVEPQNSYSNNLTPNDEFWDFQWGPYAIYADEAWDMETGGSWNVIAVIDDACDYTHSDLEDQVWYGWDYGFNDADPYPDQESQIHGTHVTGTIAASINNGIGIAGMVNDTVYFAKVTDSTYDPQFGNFSDAAIIDALYDISTIDRVGVINMSLGGPTPSAALEQACNAAWNAGKLLCVASGNDGTNVIGFPAAFESCMAIGSIGTDGQSLYLADYSQYGNEQEVVAPGGDVNTGYGILSTIPGDQYDYLQGTSMACPHVTGMAGLMMASNSNLNNVQVRQKIWESCFDFGDTGWDPVFGYGMINAQGAVIVNVSEVDSDRQHIQVEVFPNPVVDFVYIQRVDTNAEWSIEVFNVQGRLVFQESLSSGTLNKRVNLSLMEAGIYMMRISVGGRAAKVVRLVKS